jgi:hypothetical protein
MMRGIFSCGQWVVWQITLGKCGFSGFESHHNTNKTIKKLKLNQIKNSLKIQIYEIN